MRWNVMSAAMGRAMGALTLGVLLGGGPSPAEPEPDARPFHERVNEAIERGVAWLLAKPLRTRVSDVEIAHWGLTGGDGPNYAGGSEVYPYPVGATALALYTLLKCGVPPTHPTLTQGFAWIQVRHAMEPRLDGLEAWRGRGVSYRSPCTSYEISAVLLALTAKHMQPTQGAPPPKGATKIPDKADRAWAQELVDELVERRGVGSTLPRGQTMRGWRYNQVLTTTPPGTTAPEQRQVAPALPSGDEDLSSTQLALLALMAAQRVGLEVPGMVWVDAAELTLDSQEAEGPEHARAAAGPAPAPGTTQEKPVVDRARGFAYLPSSPEARESRASGAMTACGIANLLMARMSIGRSKGGKSAWAARKLEARAAVGIADGLAWLDLHWSPFRNPPFPVGYCDTYYLYALERAMDLQGKELLGAHAWYREGAEELLKRLKPARVRAWLDPRAAGEVEGGFWDVGTGHAPHDLYDTCFALLFLKRSTKALAVVTDGD